MSFGGRTATGELPVTSIDHAGRPRRRGGYPAGLLTVAMASVVGTVIMSLIPALNPTGTPLLKILAIAPMAVLNVTAVAAVVMLIVDLLLRTLNWRRSWIYALFCGVGLFAVCFALSSVGGRMNPLFVVGLALWPGAAGGWVMGLFRR